MLTVPPPGVFSHLGSPQSRYGVSTTKTTGQPATFKETATRLRRRLYCSEASYINKVLRFQRVTFITCAIPYWHIYMTNNDSASTEEKKILHIRYIYTSSQPTQARRKCFILFKSMKKRKGYSRNQMYMKWNKQKKICIYKKCFETEDCRNDSNRTL